MNDPVISVAMATFNGEKFLEAQLDSLAQQTLQPMELVVADDGSTDRTLAILDHFARQVRFPVRIFQNAQRLGFADNFLRATSLCEGQVIAFCDQDDVWMPQKLARCADALADNTVALVVHAGAVVDDTLTALDDFKPYIRRDQVLSPLDRLPNRYIPGFSMVFRADLLMLNRRSWPMTVGGKEFRLSSQALTHDTWVYYHAWVFGKIAYLREPLVLHRRHSGTATGWMPPSLQEEVQPILKTGASYFEAGSVHHGVFADYLVSMQRELTPPVQRRAAAGVQAFRRIEHILLERSELYTAQSGLVARAVQFMKMILRGQYISWAESGFGYRALIKDCVTGVFQIDARQIVNTACALLKRAV